MKKALLYGLSAVMLLSLTACGTAQANQPDEPDTTSPSAVQTEPPQESAVPSDKPDNVVEPLSANGEARELTEDELVKEFEATYAAGEEFSALLVEDESNELVVLEFELEDINLRFDNRSDIKKPANLDEQYMNWRAEAHPGTTTQASGREEIRLFVDCNEVVYAVDQVNIRASYSVDSNKLGSLARGQSITRIGNGIQGTEAEGWSKVQLSDGTIAYMVSSYLSTTKPTTQTKPSGTTHKPPNTGTQTPGTNDGTPQLPGYDPSGYDPNYNPDGDDSGFEKMDDPWDTDATIDYGD